MLKVDNEAEFVVDDDGDIAAVTAVLTEFISSEAKANLTDEDNKRISEINTANILGINFNIYYLEAIVQVCYGEI